MQGWNSWSLGAVLVIAAVSAPAPPAAAADGGAAAPPAIVPADVKTVMAAVREPGAAAVLVNVWATWCGPCREEMPHLIRFFREHQAKGVRLVLISVDDEDRRAEAAEFLAANGVDFPSWLKRDDDMKFIDAFEPRWTGAIPALFLYDGRGRRRGFWQGEATTDEIQRALAPILRAHAGSPKAGSPKAGNTKADRTKTGPAGKPGRQ